MEGAAPKEILDEAMSQPVDELLKREAALSLLRLEENRKAKISK
jgi:hypothetical protein